MSLLSHLTTTWPKFQIGISFFPLVFLRGNMLALGVAVEKSNAILISNP